MNEEKRNSHKREKGGSPPKNDPAKHRLTVNLIDQQHVDFLALHEQSGVRSLSGFIAARIFGDEFRDASSVDFIAKFTALHCLFRRIRVNYNQISFTFTSLSGYSSSFGFVGSFSSLERNSAIKPSKYLSNLST